ncbi:hypothetical protein [Streptomyces sp. NPDC050388]|uniref:hypothetical protein n=1 Tax=Streptomyces sp. NPDC050388 TaxID=3155781 RepID=UPI003417FF87
MPENTCGARQPGWENGPPIGRHRIPCVLDSGHRGDHRNALRDKWENDESTDWEEGRLEGRTETLDALVYSLGDHVRAGALTLAAAVKIYAQTTEWTEEESADFLCEFWAELMVTRLQHDG